MFLVIFMGYFIINMLVGIMATMSQPKTQVLFERENIMRYRLNKAGVYELKQKVDRVNVTKL